MTVQTITIIAGSGGNADDCYSVIAGGFNAGSVNQGGTSVGGLRWQGVNIPQGAQITSATMVLQGAGSSGTNWGTWKGIAADNPATFSTSNRPDGITSKTTASTAVIPGAALVRHDVTAIVQEIISRSGWVGGNALGIVGDVTGSDGAAVYFSTSGGYASPLIVSFVSPAGGTTGRGGLLRSKWLRNASGLGNASQMMPKAREDARQRSAINWLLDRMIYRGRKVRAKAYLGTRSDGQLYLGERDLL